jgi:hypothetical protein
LSPIPLCFIHIDGIGFWLRYPSRNKQAP